MLKLPLILLTTLVMLSSAQRALAASFTVTEWFLAASVRQASGHEADFELTVTNPFSDAGFASIGISTAESVYDFAWNDNFGRFVIEGTHQAEDADASAESNGLIYFSTTEPFAYDIDIAYSYDLPGGMLRAGFTYNLLDTDTLDSVCVGSHHDDTWTAGPVSDTLTVQHSGVLPAGHPYAFTYKMELDTYSTSGQLATGSGHVDLTLTAVPEPTTAALLGCLAPLALRRRRK